MDKKTVLLVEDETPIAENVVYALTTEGFETVWKTLGADALEHLKLQTVDLVILDVGLPDMNGFDICKEIRTRSDVPIIFLTARSEEIDRVVGLEIGADDYVSKPFSPRELTARVKAILKRVKPDIHAASAATRFTIDNAKMAIFYCGVKLDLTRYEYLILKTLLQRPEHVFSRSQLMDRVWNEPDSSFDRAVDTHIKTLRAKLKRIDNHDPIKTHRGFGYSIEAAAHEL